MPTNVSPRSSQRRSASASPFLYCYVFRLGILDGPSGAGFHVLQGFWYRYLVDAKITEVKRCMRDCGVDAATAVDRILGIDVRGNLD